MPEIRSKGQAMSLHSADMLEMAFFLTINLTILKVMKHAIKKLMVSLMLQGFQ